MRKPLKVVQTARRGWTDPSLVLGAALEFDLLAQSSILQESMSPSCLSTISSFSFLTLCVQMALCGVCVCITDTFIDKCVEWFSSVLYLRNAQGLVVCLSFHSGAESPMSFFR